MPNTQQVTAILICLALVIHGPISLAASTVKTSEVESSLAVVTAACKDPRQVTYGEREKDKSGRWVYQRFLKKADGKKFQCLKVGVLPVAKLPPPPPKDLNTEAGGKPCTDCKRPEAAEQVKALAAQTELAPTCKANTQSAADCTKDMMCTLMRDVLKISAPAAGFALSKVKLPVCGSKGAGASCGEKLALGLGNGIKNLFWGIGYLAWGGVKAVGKTAKGLFDYTVATGKDRINAIRNLFSSKPVHRTDNAMSMAHLWMQKLSKSKFTQFVKQPIQFITDFIKQIYFDTLETSKNLANCQKWKGVPLFSQCKQPAAAWACLNCVDKTETVCAMLGFATTDIASLFFAGVGIAKVASYSKAFAGFASKTTRISVKYLGKGTTRKIITAAAATGAATAKVAAPVIKAISVLEKVPGIKQYSQLQGAAIKTGLAAGGMRTANLGRRAGDLATRSDNSPTPTIPDEVEGSKLALQSTSEYLAEVAATQPKIPKVTAEEFVTQNSKRTIISEVENEAFQTAMKSKNPDSRTYVFRNSNVKNNNDNLQFDRSTAVTTTYLDRVAEKVEALKPKYKDDMDFTVQVIRDDTAVGSYGRYEGSNRLEITIAPKPGKAIPEAFNKDMAEVYKRSTAEQHLFLTENKLVRESDVPAEWFKYGEGPDSTRANLSARMNREFEGQLATFGWEHPVTQAHLKTVFIQAQSVHRSIKSQYGKTKLFDQKSGRINSSVADIVSKTKSPAQLIKELKDIYQFRGPNGKLLPRSQQLAKADELMEYVEYTKVFGVEYYGPRTVLAANNSKTASTGADVSGQNGRNISHNTKIFDSDFDEIPLAAERAEAAATKEFNRLVNAAITNREKVLRENGYTVETLRTGDDISMVIKTKTGEVVDDLPENVRRKLGDCNDGVVCLRDSIIPARVETVVKGKFVTPDKQLLIDTTHKLEKELRGILPKDKYAARNFWIEVSPTGEMRLQMSYPAKTTAAEILELQKLEHEAQRAFKRMVDDKNPDSILGLRASHSDRLNDSTRLELRDEYRDILGRDLNDAQFKVIQENFESNPIWVYDYPSKDLHDVIGMKEYERLDAAYTQQYNQKIIESKLFSDREKFILLLERIDETARQRTEYLSRQNPDRTPPTSSTLDTGKKTVFRDLENRIKKVEDQFEFPEVFYSIASKENFQKIVSEDNFQKNKFFSFRYSSPEKLDEAYLTHPDPDVVSAYKAGKIDPKQLIREDYNQVLNIAEFLGRRKFKNIDEFNAHFKNISGHLDSGVQDPKLFSLRLNSTIEIKGSKIRTNVAPSYRALLCRTASGTIYVFNVYRKITLDDPKYFKAYEDDIYDRARKTIQSGAVKCVDPL
jgi:hypothetical protein